VSLLAKLLRRRQQQLGALGVGGEVSPSMLLAGLIEQAARAEGLELNASKAAASPPDTSPESGAPAKVDPLAARVRKKRLAREMTQAEVADFFGLRQATLALIESGRRPVPRRLRALVERWVRDASVPTNEELPAPRSRTRWQAILDDDVIPDSPPEPTRAPKGRT
jgi:hypothetical protein